MGRIIDIDTCIGFEGLNRERGVEVYSGGEFLGAFPSLTEASTFTGVSTDKICNICRGKRKASKGFTFKYVSDDSIPVNVREFEYIFDRDDDLYDESLFDDNMGGEKILRLGKAAY